MKSVMVSLVLVGICFSANMYSMEQQDNTKAVNNAIKAQKLYAKGQEVISKMEFNSVFCCCPDEEGYNMIVAKERGKANDLFCKSRRSIQHVLNDKNADEVTKKTALDIEKKIDAIPWASK
jgi:hypothetical protein